MANMQTSIRSLYLSALEVKQMTGWNDAMTEDYLSMLQNILALAQASDAGAEIIAQIQSEIAAINEQIALMQAQIDEVTNRSAWTIIYTDATGAFAEIPIWPKGFILQSAGPDSEPEFSEVIPQISPFLVMGA